MSAGVITRLFSLIAAGNFALAFTFDFIAGPTQCMNATVQWTGGTAPFKLLLVPTGSLHPEIRTIADYTIDAGNSFSFQLKYPGNSTFVAVMSDATGFGAGSTTSVRTVASGSNTACLDRSQVAPEFFIYTSPSVPQECSPMTISYSADAQPPVDLFVVIPGGASSRIESGSPTNKSFEWTPSLHAGTQLMIVGGDTSGAGKGGSTDILTVASGNSSDCLVANTTSTAGSTPAATQTSKAMVSLSSLRSWNVVLGLLLCFFQ
ncbi:hypothetical protein JB92DRAFT_3131171 [Gautieria morchelliformis]|nr:hypothetical protein JB92DRAFT_3131171 [Gautieria morchelliformis]